MDIGKELYEVTIEPIELPVPSKLPDMPKPAEIPELVPA